MSAEKVVDFLETYRGRDKLLRTICYISKMTAGLVESEKLAKQLDNLGSQLSSSRTAFRLLDDIPMLVHFINYGLGKKDKDRYIKLGNVASNVVDLAFFPIDHISWAVDHQIITSQDTRWGTASTVCWAISLYLSLVISARKLVLLLEEKNRIQEDNPENKKAKAELAHQQKKLILGMFKSFADLLFAVNYFPENVFWSKIFSKVQTGALGTFSSLLSLYLVLI